MQWVIKKCSVGELMWQVTAKGESWEREMEVGNGYAREEGGKLFIFQNGKRLLRDDNLRQFLFGEIKF